MANNIISAAPSGNPLRRYFSRYFRARWQNYQNVVTNDVFFSQMPPAWLTYQQTYVRQWDEWTRGFVLQLHKGDFFSVGMGKTVCDILTRECTKGRFRFDGQYRPAVDFVTTWAQASQFSNLVSEGFMNANRLGNNILRLNAVAEAGECYPSVHSVDRTFFEVNRKQGIIRARFLDYLSANTVDGSNYYCIEDRVFFEGAPYYCVRILEQKGTVTNPTFDLYKKGLSKLDFFTQSRFADLYGDITPGKWYKLPFKTLGCYNWKNKETSVAINSMPGFSESSVHTALDILYSIDYNWSMGQLDMYWGRTRVLVPKEMRTVKVREIHNGVDYSEAISAAINSPLEDDLYTQLPGNTSIDGKQPQPLFIQPDLRGEVHKYIRDADLELLAAKVGLSASTLANHLNDNNGKTATEVTSETTTTDITVSTKRELAEVAINAMLKDVVEFYGLNSNVEITWNDSLKGDGKSKDEILREYEQGVMPIDEAIKRLHPELSQDEVDEWVRKLEAKDEMADIFDTSKRLI